MTYNPDIPLATESPATSASQIQTNFSQFAAIFSRSLAGVTYNHKPFNDFSQGKHASVLMQNQSSDPEINQINDVLYAKNATSKLTTEPQIFARIPIFLPTAQDTTQASNDPMQVTYNSVNLTAPIYQSFLIGGYLIYFGSTTGIPITITLTPTPTEILMVQAAPQATRLSGGVANTPYGVGVFVTQPNKFLIRSDQAPTPPGSTTFVWMAIAKA